MRRDDRKSKTYFRSERIFCMNGSWYFATREGEQGPFFSRTRAEDALKRFLGDKRELAAFQESRTIQRATTGPHEASHLGTDLRDAMLHKKRLIF